MQNGRAVFSGPLTPNHATAAQQLHLPLGAPGADASPYFCLSDLAKRWPSNDRAARREVIMITDGVDYYHLQYDPEDPYVQAAIQDLVRANLVVGQNAPAGRQDYRAYNGDTAEGSSRDGNAHDLKLAG